MNVIEDVLKASGIDDLNPVQKKALKTNFLRGCNLVVSAPTASGKTLIAEIASLNTINQGKKAVYIVPLRAIASEKYEEFRKKYEPLGVKVAISIGDFDKSDPWLAKFDLIIVTSEKFDSLLRHGINWVDKIGLVVADEIHLLNDPLRGPTLEIILTKLREIANPQILGLSATIKNYDEIAKWLDAEVVKSDFRPVKLYKGVCYDKKVFYQPKKDDLELSGEKNEIYEIVENTLKNKKQVIIFVSTRKAAEKISEEISKIVRQTLKASEIQELEKISLEIENVLDHPTKQCEKLAKSVRDGVAFHHAGIVNEQRQIIEKNFKNGLIKIIAATPTLAAGINMPAFRVIIKDIRRFSMGYGMDYIPVLEIQQMMGRCGRPKFDKEGEAIIIAKNKEDAEFIWNNYINGEPEEIKSKLGVETVLRMHVLALISSVPMISKNDLIKFFSKTFYAHQYKNLDNLKIRIENVLLVLENFGFIERVGKSKDSPFSKASSQDEIFKATIIGRRVSELYIDPLTANHIIQNLKNAKYINDINLLQLISNTIEMKPLLSLKKDDFDEINEFLIREGENLIQKPPNPWDLEYDDYLRSIKTALMFKDWIEEVGEDKLLEKFGITPGELRIRLETADWLLYATHELALLLVMKDFLKDIRKIRIRVKYGIKEELLPLIQLKGVGRVRSRILYNSNIKSLSDLRKIPIESLSRIIGPKIAMDIKNQLNQIDKNDTQKILEFYE